MSDLFQEQLQALRAQSLQRKLREIGSAQGSEIEIVGRHLVNFSSNDYLGLAADPLLRRAAIGAIEKFGVGAGASRLVSGTQSPHVALEAALAKWKCVPAALTFSSGYAAAVGTLTALASKRDVVILDKLSHASLIDGARLSGATVRVFPHNHLGKLESHLEWAQRELPEARRIVVTESVFSMDGDQAPLGELIELKKRFDAILLLDEAHAIGVLGPNGRGLAAELGLERQVDVQLGTLSKALGVSGGYVCGSRSLIDWLINRARSFVFSTAPPPALAAAATAAIEFLASAEGEARRIMLWKRIVRLGAELPAAPEASGKSGGAIIPWIVGDEQRALDLARSLQREGFLVPAIRYPTVAKGAARLRITVSAAHTEAQIAQLGEAMRRLSVGDYGPVAAERRSSGVGT
ncbi:MAG: 8-amino-7-oxononanoate synthase [Chthoniobacterales bacterium]|nr:8-amino-7-oxononanoate synthase [Chthoniobacterales bacterium]